MDKAIRLPTRLSLGIPRKIRRQIQPSSQASLASWPTGVDGSWENRSIMGQGEFTRCPVRNQSFFLGPSFIIPLTIEMLQGAPC